MPEEKNVAPIEILTTPSCPACKVTKSLLDRADMAYETVALEDNPERADEVRALGHAQAPVVIVPNDPAYGAAAGTMWSGLRPDLIASLTA